MTAAQTFDVLSRSEIIQADGGQGKGLEAHLAPNPHQGNRVIGLMGGKRCVIAQRPGKTGGMDFTRLLGGKVMAVAADSVSPVYEKKDGKPTKNQKLEDGLPLFSCSGFYGLSTRDHPALLLTRAYTRLEAQGALLHILTPNQLKLKEAFTLRTPQDLNALRDTLAANLGLKHPLLARFDEQANHRRKRAIQRAQEDAQDNGQTYAGAQFQPLAASPKDLAPLLLLSAKIRGQLLGASVSNMVGVEDPKHGPQLRLNATDQTIGALMNAPFWKALSSALADPASQEEPVTVVVAVGSVLRTSPSFLKKARNVQTGAASSAFGEGPYITQAAKSWVKGIVAIMQSLHPEFPQKDYTCHYYVGAPRQAEIGFKRAGPNNWQTPQVPAYKLALALLEGVDRAPTAKAASAPLTQT